MAKLTSLLIRYGDYETISAIQASIYNTRRMVFGMYGTMCQAHGVGMRHMITSDVLLVFADKGEKAVKLDGRAHTDE